MKRATEECRSTNRENQDLTLENMQLCNSTVRFTTVGCVFLCYSGPMFARNTFGNMQVKRHSKSYDHACVV